MARRQGPPARASCGHGPLRQKPSLDAGARNRLALGKESVSEPVNMALVLLASAFLAAPVALAAIVDWQVRQFQREAFGHLRKAARNLRVMAWAVLVYYAGVLGGSAAIGDLGDMAAWPMPTEGMVVYVRLGAAILAYTLALFVAKELYLVTRPGKMAPGAPTDDGQ